MDSVDKTNFFTIKTMEELMTTSQFQTGLPHRHDYYTIMWVKEAAGKHLIDFKTYDFKDNCVFLFGPWQVHLVEHTSIPKGVVLLFSLDLLSRCGMSTEFMTELNLFSDVDDNSPLFIPDQYRSKFQSIIDNIYHEVEKDDELKLDIIGSYLKIFMLEFQRVKTMTMGNSEQSAGTPTSRLLIREFNRLVNQHYKELHQVNAYALRMSITPSHLNNVISKTLGTTAKDFIINRIMLEAKRMIYYSGLNLKEIAYELGFNDPAYFSKLFYKRNGVRFKDFKTKSSKM